MMRWIFLISLPVNCNQVDELDREYKVDLRQYERESRQRQRARQAQRRMARAGGQKGKSDDA